MTGRLVNQFTACKVHADHMWTVYRCMSQRQISSAIRSCDDDVERRQNKSVNMNFLYLLICNTQVQERLPVIYFTKKKLRRSFYDQGLEEADVLQSNFQPQHEMFSQENVNDRFFQKPILFYLYVLIWMLTELVIKKYLTSSFALLKGFYPHFDYRAFLWLDSTDKKLSFHLEMPSDFIKLLHNSIFKLLCKTSPQGI